MSSYNEVTTSSQEGSYDSDGYLHTTRTFQVMGVTPATFWGAFQFIPNLSTGQPGLPAYGDEFLSTTGPVFQGTEPGVSVKCVMYEYTLQPVSAVLFIAVAHYTNDPRRTPLGVNYTSTQQLTFVPIPVVRQVPIIAAGASSGSTVPVFAYEELVYQAPMQVERISHTVSLQRTRLKVIETAIEQQAGVLHKLPIKNYSCKFEGGDITMRGPQWLDVRYHWTYESGVTRYDANDWGRAFDTNDAPSGSLIRLIPPPNRESINPLETNTGAEKFILPPYHTIELGWEVVDDVDLRKPLWFYRIPLRLGAGSFNPTWQGLPGSEKFIWNGL